MEVAGRLAALKAGQDIRLEDIADLGYQTGLFDQRKKEQQLRAMLDGINRARERCLEGALGMCEQCGRDRPVEVVNECPWKLQCMECDS